MHLVAVVPCSLVNDRVHWFPVLTESWRAEFCHVEFKACKDSSLDSGQDLADWGRSVLVVNCQEAVDESLH